MRKGKGRRNLWLHFQIRIRSGDSYPTIHQLQRLSLSKLVLRSPQALKRSSEPQSTNPEASKAGRNRASASDMSHDPYHDFAGELRNDLETTRTLAKSYASIKQNRLHHTEAEITSARDKLQDALEGLSSDLEDVKQSVDVVSRVPKRFGLDETEIDERRKFVADCERHIEVLSRSSVVQPKSALTLCLRRQELSRLMSQSAQAPSFGGRAGRTYNSSREDEAIDDDGEDPNEAFEREHQDQLIHQQDSTLDRIGSTLTNLRSQASVMGHEIGEQLELVGNLDTEVDSTQNRLSGAMKKMDEIVRRGDERLGGWCVWILIVVSRSSMHPQPQRFG